ncbi:hypothetical protein GBA52_012255, partial [Prunus armeniaca]
MKLSYHGVSMVLPITRFMKDSKDYSATNISNFEGFKSVKIAFYSYDSEERDLVNILPSLSLKPSNLPARDAPWKW